MDTLQIYCVNTQTECTVPVGSSLAELARNREQELGFRPLCAKVNNRMTALYARLYEPARIEFTGIQVEGGLRTYVRTLSMVLGKAVQAVLPGAELYLEHSLSNGYYGFIRNGGEATAEEIALIKEEMDRIIAADSVFTEHTVPVEQARELFTSLGRGDVTDLITTTGKLYFTYHELDGYIDTFYGPLAPSAGYLYLYDLIPYMGGVLLRVPDIEDPTRLAPMEEQSKMKEVFLRQNKLLDVLHLSYVGSLNKAVQAGKAAELIRVSEAVQEKEIAAIAEQIALRYKQGVRVVLVSGPSSSGKTTFTKRLCVQLITNLLTPKSISLDNYFLDREHTPRDENGEYDFESLYALDLEQFNKDLTALLAGEKVPIPGFDFVTGTRSYKGEELQLHDGEILVMEGIHALNPDLLPSVPSKYTFKVYVSALTALGIDRHNRIPTTDNRLLRRMVRDFRYRGSSAERTLAYWNGVRRGEEKWVFPYQENADAMFNSAMVYELATLRSFAEPLLREVPQSSPRYARAQRLLLFLEQIAYIPPQSIPSVSLLREFLGGSSFHY